MIPLRKGHPEYRGEGGGGPFALTTSDPFFFTYKFFNSFSRLISCNIIFAQSDVCNLSAPF